MFRVALVTNMPVPYREQVLKRLGDRNDIDLFVIYCTRIEKNRLWLVNEPPFNHAFLKERFISRSDGTNFIHTNFDVWSALRRFRPAVVITCGFNPTHILAFLYALLHGVRHVPMTDGTVHSEAGLGWVHRVLRRLIYARSSAFLAASKGGIQLYRSYGIDDERIFRSHLCADNELFLAADARDERAYDVMFSGRFHERKMPHFFVQVVAELVARRGHLSVLLIGSGPLEEVLLRALERTGAEVFYPGFIDQSELYEYYSNAKVLLFPSAGDAWGVVANEALAAGTVVITTPEAGVADDLVLDGVTGFVLAANIKAWADRCDSLLDDATLRNAIAMRGRNHVRSYNYQAAADGIYEACRCALT